jgi:DNA-binding NarL/FixJ family response regulator
VLIEVAAGLSNDEVAQALHVSPATVRTYVSRLFGKVDVTSRSQLVVIAYETGLAGAR